VNQSANANSSFFINITSGKFERFYRRLLV
jgi:hypothetical protein